MKARTLLKRLTDYGLAVNHIGDNIRLSPRQLVNDKVLAFVRAHKNDLLCALHDEEREKHLARKHTLNQGRLEVLRILIRRFLNDAKCREMVNYKGTAVINDKAVEDYIDTELTNFDYELEAMIDMYRIYAPQPIQPVLTCNKCGYRPLFCACGTQAPGVMNRKADNVVSCNACEHFTPDEIGDGSGIGHCSLGIDWTQEPHGRMPLYRYADRRCSEFSKSQM